MKKCIFTVCIGDYDYPPSVPKQNNGWDYIVFTDNPDAQSMGWTRVIEVEKTDRPDLVSRKYKWLSHKYIPEYDMVFYHDANISVEKELPVKPFRVIHHKRVNVNQEVRACIDQMHRWSKESLEEQWKHYMSEGYPDNNGLYLNGVFCRLHNDIENKLCEEVYANLERFTTRDQIAMPYAMWKLGYKVRPPEVINASTIYKRLRISYHKIRKPRIYGGDVEISVHHITPSRTDRNLGRAINDIIKGIPSHDWICVRDMDTLVLDTASFTEQCELIAKQGEYDLVSCVTNRLGLEHQLYKGKISNNPDISYHKGIAEDVYKGGVVVKPTEKEVAGLMHLYPKTVWEQVGGYPEGFIVYEDQLIDYKFYKSVRDKGFRVGICESIYLFHLYRWGKDTRSLEAKLHLLSKNHGKYER